MFFFVTIVTSFLYFCTWLPPYLFCTWLPLFFFCTYIIVHSFLLLYLFSSVLPIVPKSLFYLNLLAGLLNTLLQIIWVLCSQLTRLTFSSCVQKGRDNKEQEAWCIPKNYEITKPPFLCKYYATPETHTKRKATQHDCLSSLLGDGDTWIQIVYEEVKIFLYWATRQSMQDKNLLYRHVKPNEPFHLYSLSPHLPHFPLSAGAAPL
jgi:hypothetical protein